jgi:hypothetical protein
MINSSAELKTTFRNTSGTKSFFGFLPPHGRTLDSGEDYVFFGSLDNLLSAITKKAQRSSLIAALDAGTVTIISDASTLAADEAVAAIPQSNTTGFVDITSAWDYHVIATTSVNTSSGYEIITSPAHGWSTGDAVYYTNEGGASIGGLSSGNLYYIRVLTSSTFALYDTLSHANNTESTSGRKDLTSTGNSNQRFTKRADVTITYDTAVHTADTFLHLNGVFGNIVANFTNISLATGQSDKFTVTITNTVGDDFNFTAAKTNGVSATFPSSAKISKDKGLVTIEFVVINRSSNVTIYAAPTVAV